MKIRFEKSVSYGTVAVVIVNILLGGIYIGTMNRAVAEHENRLNKDDAELLRHQMSIEELQRGIAETMESNKIMAEILKRGDPPSFKPKMGADK